MAGVAPTRDDALRLPDVSDGAAIQRLIESCKPLDVNSTYAYLLLCRHFRDTCVVAERQGRLAGFLSAYIPPAQSDALFVWQVAVAASARGEGLAHRMLDHVLARPALRQVRFVETTVSPSNDASRRLFAGLARRRGVACEERPLFTRSHFGGAAHEDEPLLRIGPF